MEPQDVKIVDTDKPIDVNIAGDTSKEKRLVNKADQQSLEPTTTDQEDITHAGQRRINLVWEHTQAAIAITVTASAMICGIFTTWAAVFYSKEIQIPTIITGAFFLVSGFYFARTNHAAIGGVGNKPREKYEGR